MVGSRTVTAVVGLLLSVAVSIAAYVYFDTLFLFLFVPFIPFLLRRGRDDSEPAERVCPECGFSTRNPGFEHCPRDGTRLESAESAWH